MKKVRFSKGTLHYMKQNARSEKQFTLNAHVRERLEGWEVYILCWASDAQYYLYTGVGFG